MEATRLNQMMWGTKLLPVSECVDVAVVGGGIAGISAALAAARTGAKTLLIEREYALGGLATLGLITHYLPLCDGCGRQVSFGIAEELLRLSIKYGAEAQYPAAWLDRNDPEERRTGPRFRVQYNAVLMALMAEQELLHAGVRILYGSLLLDALVKDDAVDALVVQNKSGLQAIKAKAFVDASGDADLVHFSGENTRLFGQGNILAAWYYSAGSDGLKLHQLGACDIPEEYKKKGEKEQLLSEKRFSGLDGKELSEAVCQSHAVVLNDYIRRRSTVENLFPTSIATIPQVRMTRCLQAGLVMDDKEPHKRYESSIGMTGDWRKRGPVYELPFEIIHSQKRKNLYAAGRCISVTDSMWDITRVIPPCATTGQAAGTAAALFGGGTPDVKQLQNQLKKDGVILHESDI